MKIVSLERLQKLVTILSDGKFHSGEKLAGILGVSRTAIWKLTNKLENWGVELFSVRGKGYKIPNGLSLIDSQYVEEEIRRRSELFTTVKVLSTVDSTSSYVTRNKPKGIGEGGQIVISEHQTEGRGRNGKTWASPFGTNLYFSIGINLPMGLNALGGLSLAIGIGLTRLLNQHTNQEIKLKWPNDLLVGGRKMAGILLEASGNGDGNENGNRNVSGSNLEHSYVNIGVGVNWKMPAKTIEIQQPWANLSEILNKEIGRSRLLVNMLIALDEVLSTYVDQGFEPFRSHWIENSAYFGRQVTLSSRNGSISGIEAGVDCNGALKLKTNVGEKVFYSGEVSLRATPKTT